MSEYVNRPSNVRVIDGATSTEICRRGVGLHPVCWSGLASLTHPDLIKSIHLHYLQAGARLITSNTFAASRHILQAAGSAELFETANRQSIEIAIDARDESGATGVLVAGSLSTLPPLNYPDRAPRGIEIEKNHSDQSNILAQSGADLLLVEMLYDSASALPLIDACLATGVPVWVGVTASRLSNGQLIAYRPSGKYESLQDESFGSLISNVADRPVTAIGVMHTPLPIMHDALTLLRKFWNGPAFAYPETGHFKEPDWDFTHTVRPIDFAKQMCAFAKEFSLGAIGGCCGTTPEHIQALDRALHRQSDDELNY